MKVDRIHRIVASALVIAVLAFGVGCSDNNTNVIDPAFQPEVTNNIDNFQFQATNVTNVSQVLTYSWRNTGVQANVDQSCSITAGTATLTLSDSTGTQVYTRSLADGGSIPTAAGVPGMWTIRVMLNHVNGTLNFRAQKKT
jgi:hypothetical protein